MRAFLTALLLLTAGSVAWAQPMTATAPATSPAAEDEPAVDEIVPEALLRAARESFVIVEFWYKKDLSDAAKADHKDWRTRRLYSDFVDQKRPEERAGLVVDDGLVLVADSAIEDRFLEKIVVRDVRGRRHEATRERLLTDAPGVLLRLAPPKKRREALHPLAFVPVEDRGVNTLLLSARLFQSDDQWRIDAASLPAAVPFAPGKAKNVHFGDGSRNDPHDADPELIADETGRPVGVDLSGEFDMAQKLCAWKGADLLAPSASLDWKLVRAAEDKARAALIDCVHQVVFQFGKAGHEYTTYALAVSPTELLIPEGITRQSAAQIRRIFLKEPPAAQRRADFVGAYKGFDAVLLRLREGKLPAHVELGRDDPQRMKPFWAATCRERFGRKYVDLGTARLVGKQRGYAGAYSWRASPELPSGAFLVNFQGQLVGLYVPQRPEDEATRQYLRKDEPAQRIYPISELRDALARPGEHMDPRIVVKTASESRRRAWFGVEYSRINRDLAEAFKVSKPTQDGQVGFVVSAVYAGSPAEKVGIRVGDILLRLKSETMAYPIELLPARARDEEYDSRRRSAAYAESESEEWLGEPEPTWRNRKNTLTEALDAVGIGKEVSIWYVRPDGTDAAAAKELKYRIEQAPVDQDSAGKWQNRSLGLTVKDMTYEVRHGLNLRDSDAGVVVAKVEDGSPMQVARIFANEVLTRLDDAPLTSAARMRELVAAARQAGKDKVRLTVLRLGKTRFADLPVAAYDPRDDEGLDEGEE
ncbi:MAG TPA: PDZ domain-containing protein [Phycisphaerae bacterium]|nr:PDZ domain-containing protein [Phycisphaerae bacterium]